MDRAGTVVVHTVAAAGQQTSHTADSLSQCQAGHGIVRVLPHIFIVLSAVQDDGQDARNGGTIDHKALGDAVLQCSQRILQKLRQHRQDVQQLGAQEAEHHDPHRHVEDEVRVAVVLFGQVHGEPYARQDTQRKHQAVAVDIQITD